VLDCAVGSPVSEIGCNTRPPSSDLRRYSDQPFAAAEAPSVHWDERLQRPQGVVTRCFFCALVRSPPWHASMEGMQQPSLKVISAQPIAAQTRSHISIVIDPGADVAVPQVCQPVSWEPLSAQCVSGGSKAERNKLDGSNVLKAWLPALLRPQ
jgi:hypothetical protein